MERDTYTIKELAHLLGVPPKDVHNAKTHPSKNPKPGSAIHRVVEGMKARGISWEQIVSGYARSQPAEALPAQGSDQADPESEVADREAAPTALPASPAPQAPTHEAYLLSHLETPAPAAPETSAPVSAPTEASPPRVHAHADERSALEDIIGELKRRLPSGASISITF